LKKGMMILDLGCGTGNISSQLLEFVSVKSIGVDKSYSMLKKAKAKALHVLCADAEHIMPFRENSFDVVIGAYVIHHLKNRDALIKECFRILDNGSLIFLISSHDQIERMHPVIKDFFPKLVELDKKIFPEISELEYFFKTAGFKNIRHEELIIRKIRIDLKYLEKVKNKFISTFYLLPETEFNTGVKKLEAFIRNIQEPLYRDWCGTMICGEKQR
jgi:ubiquinone/menaquinone biosynthesis C-methylase UbiE